MVSLFVHLLRFRDIPEALEGGVVVPVLFPIARQAVGRLDGR